MADFEVWPAKDPDDIEPYFFIWCDEDGINTGDEADTGILQGATIATSTWTFPTGITKDSENENAITIHGVSYGANTVTTVWISGGTADTDYTISCKITTSAPARTLSKTAILPVRQR